MKYQYIKTNRELNAYLKTYEDRKNHIIALDIEAESNLHAYGERLCLVQILDDGHKILIDPFDIKNSTLKKLFEDQKVLKVMYDASSDLSLMKNCCDIDIKSILDLRPAVDLLEYKDKDLHSVIGAELGVVLKNKSKYQRHNWTRRPIDKRAIDYALNDVNYLMRLKDAILARLVAKKLLDVFLLKNLLIQTKDYKRDPGEKHIRVRGYHGLAEREKAVFKRVYDVREKYARLINMPAHNIIGNASLLKMAQGEESPEDIKFPKRLSAEMVGNILREIRSELAPRPESP